MEQTNGFLEQSLSVILFCTAVQLLFWQLQQIEEIRKLGDADGILSVLFSR